MRFFFRWMKNNMEGQELDFSNTANNSGNYTLWIKKKNEDINKKYDNYIFIVVIHNSNFKNYRHLGSVL